MVDQNTVKFIQKLVIWRSKSEYEMSQRLKAQFCPLILQYNVFYNPFAHID